MSSRDERRARLRDDWAELAYDAKVKGLSVGQERALRISRDLRAELDASERDRERLEKLTAFVQWMHRDYSYERSRRMAPPGGQQVGPSELGAVQPSMLGRVIRETGHVLKACGIEPLEDA